MELLSADDHVLSYARALPGARRFVMSLNLSDRLRPVGELGYLVLSTATGVEIQPTHLRPNEGRITL